MVEQCVEPAPIGLAAHLLNIIPARQQLGRANAGHAGGGHVCHVTRPIGLVVMRWIVAGAEWEEGSGHYWPHYFGMKGRRGEGVNHRISSPLTPSPPHLFRF